MAGMAQRFGWREAYRVDLEEIDQQHRKLMALIGALVEPPEAGGKSAQAALSELADYTRYHFRSEEGLMEKLGYPALAEHRREHAGLIERLLDLQAEFLSAPEGLNGRLAAFAEAWLEQHVQRSDAAFSAFVRARRGKAGARGGAGPEAAS